MMDPGFSEPWPQALEAMTGTAKMDASSMLRYFEPLKTWLEEANTLAKDCTGWDGTLTHFIRFDQNLKNIFCQQISANLTPLIT